MLPVNQIKEALSKKGDGASFFKLSLALNIIVILVDSITYIWRDTGLSGYAYFICFLFWLLAGIKIVAEIIIEYDKLEWERHHGD